MGTLYLSCLTLLVLLGGCFSQESESPVDEHPESSQPSGDVDYQSPSVDGQYFFEHFDDAQLFSSRWMTSSASKADSSELKYDGEWDRVQSQTQLKG